MIFSYTEGIKQRCDNAEINASLYNNRAACHWHLKNYRSSLFDSEKALTFNPEHTKARIRAAKSALEVAKYDTCIEHCQKLLLTSKEKEITEILNKAKKSKMIQERDQRKNERRTAKENEQKDLVIKAIIDRGIKISKCDDEDDIDLSKLEPSLPGAQDSIVHIDNGILKWPILLLYPEYQLTDFIKDCPENVSLLLQLQQVFPAPWDENNKYHCNSINVYFEGYDKMPHIVAPSKNLSELLVEKYFELKAGTPAFFVLPKGSAIERRFIESFL